MRFSIKRLLPRTLFGRSLLILVTPVMLIQVISAFVFFDRHWDRMTTRLAFAVAGEIAIVADQIEQGADSEEIKTIANYAASNLQLLISVDEGGVLEKQEALGSSVARTLSNALSEQVRRPYHVDVGAREKWVEVAIQLDTGLLHISLPQRRLFSSSGYIFLLWMIGVSVVLLAIAVLFMRNQIRPIRRLAIVAERFGKGREIPSSFKPEGAREIRQAAQAFIDMHERIRRQISQRTAMLAGVSHDLRTPLTRMKLQTAMLGDSPDVEALKADIKDMERMIDAYLSFARGDGGENTEHTDIKAMLERIATGVRRQGTDIELKITGDLLLSIRPVSFERCLNNITNNARKFANNIWVSASGNGEFIEIAVDDDGPGIPPELFDDVFKPFYRAEPSRNQATGGVGLGLPIAQDIVHSHGGEIWLEKSNRGGVRVVIRLPV